MNMFKGRNLINALGIPGWLFLIWKGDIYYSFFILTCIVFALGEFYNMMEKKGTKPLRWVGMCSAAFIADFYYSQPIITGHQMVGCVILIVLLTFIWELFSNEKNSGLNISVTMAGILFVPILLGTAIDIRQFDTFMGSQLTLALVLSVWACDSAAFIFGTKFGTVKIFPRVSPNKSWVGSIAGLIASMSVFYLFYHQEWLGNYFSLKDTIIFGFIAGVFGQIGDFAESLLKRDANVKDSGTILQGHGGVLDRFDSLIFATPITYFYVHFLMNF
ncbi:MAG: phosphatidate cytidylyltransferase [Candidatus Marinimicrobia bacterium]|jgi:phosphatidate cytidylyltransferase|nr:phosphatidate cytidylyltransferase [Candidatus Neomarinimicrobiota bacterium]MBT7115449.1 phosphatidate cytidylyltransferase [Candidatus Neomarinimicrobiota bacterium]MBT7278566.1 phosphatidate cytidylyltransferase [Candidatus Neomarinimicrobiota bacterium]